MALAVDLPHWREQQMATRREGVARTSCWRASTGKWRVWRAKSVVEAGISTGTASSRARLGKGAFGKGAFGNGAFGDDVFGNDLFGDRE